MALLDTTKWYDLARTTNWTPRHVSAEELFPREMSDIFNIPFSEWEKFDEPYKTSYREYVDMQSRKDADVYSVRAALVRARIYDEADPGWRSILKLHYGVNALGEIGAGIAEAKMARFGKAPGLRNTATFGMLDEIRHQQLQLFFAHELLAKDRQFDWAIKALHTNNWASVAGRLALDDMEICRDAASIPITMSFSLEQGFTNLQFLGLAGDAAKVGDFSFANLISSIQTDESRHAQVGAATLKVLIANGHKQKAQRLMDIAFWRSWRLFLTLTGPCIDYYTPLEKREQSFREFVDEWIVGQFERSILDLGLDKPWYWDQFIVSTGVHHHGVHLGNWFWRRTLFWDPTAGVTAAERAWLEEKYPGWNDTWGRSWDVITDNVLNGRSDKLNATALPTLCNTCGITIVGAPYSGGHSFQEYPLEYEGRLYHFCTEPCRWVFECEPRRLHDHLSISDRFLAGEIQPQSVEGALTYMGIDLDDFADDAHAYSWALETDQAAALKRTA